MFERLRQGLRHVLHHGAEGAEPIHAPHALDSTEARLTIHQHDDLIELRPTFAGDPMLRVRAFIAGPLSTARIASRSSTSLLRLQIPVRADGRDATIEITVMRAGRLEADDAAHPSAGFVLARARRRRIPPDRQAVEILYSHPQDLQVRYLVAMESTIQPLDFKEYAQHESVFKEVPSVSQMVAFLRATLHHRRTTLRSLGSMARNTAVPHVHCVVDDMTRRLSQGQDFTTERVRHTLAWLGDEGRSVNPNTVSALALLCDIYLENIGSEQLDALVDRGEELPVSKSALAATVAFLGAVEVQDRWTRALPALLQDESGPAERALAFLQSTVARRNTLSILTDLADDSGSERSRTRVDQLLARVGADQNLLNDEHLALQAYFEARGRKVQAETISALAIYVDFEAGILNEDDIDGLTPQRAFVDASLYSMLAIARAFDYDLRCWLLPFIRSHDAADHDKMWKQLEDLVTLSEGGIVARFLESGQAGHETVYIAAPDDVTALRARGYIFTGEFLADFATLHHLQEVELGAFEALGVPIIARFMSDSGVVAWRRLDVVERASSAALRELLKRPYSFADRYEIFHFAQNVLGAHEPVAADALVGRDNVLVVYRDARGAAHYKHVAHVDDTAQITTAPQRDWDWAQAVVRFPDAALFPRLLTEASHEFLLGLPDDRASLGRLDLVYSGLEDSLSAPPPSVALSEKVAPLQEAMQSAAIRALLVGIIDVGARDDALGLLELDRDRRSLAPVLAEACDSPALLEVAALLVLHALCGDAGARIACDTARFDALLLDRLLAAAEDGDVEVRRCAVELMGTYAAHARAEQRLAFSYVLTRLMDNDVATVSRAAARALGTIALRDVHPPVRLTTVGAPPRATAEEVDADRTAEEVLIMFSLPAEHHKAVVTMLAGLLPESDAMAVQGRKAP